MEETSAQFALWPLGSLPKLTLLFAWEAGNWYQFVPREESRALPKAWLSCSCPLPTAAWEGSTALCAWEVLLNTLALVSSG